MVTFEIELHVGSNASVVRLTKVVNVRFCVISHFNLGLYDDGISKLALLTVEKRKEKKKPQDTHTRRCRYHASFKISSLFHASYLLFSCIISLSSIVFSNAFAQVLPFNTIVESSSLNIAMLNSSSPFISVIRADLSLFYFCFLPDFSAALSRSRLA